MKSFKLLLAASVLALTATAAAAQGVGNWSDPTQSGTGSQIQNNQINLQTNWSNLNASVDTVGGDVVAQGTAAGNMVDVTTMNDTRVSNNQIVGPNATIGSNVALDVNNAWGSVGITNQVSCNSANVSTDPVMTQVKSNQVCNSFEADSNAPNFPIVSRQINNSASVSNVNANVFNAAGSVGLSSSAVGNTSQVIHYSTN